MRTYSIDIDDVGTKAVTEITDCEDGGTLIIEYIQLPNGNKASKTCKCCCGSGDDRKCATKTCDDGKNPTCSCNNGNPSVTC